jgi:glycosidase
MNNLSHGFDKIDSKYGTNEIFKALIEKYHSRNIKIIIDLIPNYTNDDHLWFKMSQNNKTYFDYYVWTKNINNWVLIIFYHFFIHLLNYNTFNFR